MNNTMNNNTKKNKRSKQLSRRAMLRNINGLSLGDKAYCGPYGTVRCTSRATASAPRKFSVSGNQNKKLANRGNYTMTQIREAVCA